MGNGNFKLGQYPAGEPMVSDISSPEDLLGIFPVQRGEDSVLLHDVHRPASLAVLEEVPDAARSSDKF
jgi:hypothetical protein